MFAIDSVDNPEKELFLTFTVFTQFENTYLAFLNILAKCDFLEKMALGVGPFYTFNCKVYTFNCKVVRIYS